MPPGPPHPRPLLVALGAEAQALRLIHAAFWRAREQGVPWIAVHVEIPMGLSPEESDQVEIWMHEAIGLGGQSLRLQAPSVVAGLLEAVRQTEAQAILVGRRRGRWPWARLGHGQAQELARRGPAAHIVPIALGEEIPERSAWPRPGKRVAALVGSLGILGSLTGLGSILPPEEPLPAIFLLYLLGTTVIAQQWGRAVGATACLASALIFDLLFDTAPGSLVVGNWPLMALFLLVLAGGQFAIRLSERLQAQARTVQRREALMAVLLLLGRDLGRATQPEGIAQALADQAFRLFRARLDLLLPRGEGWIKFPAVQGESALDITALRLHLEQRPQGRQPEPWIQDGISHLPLLGAEGLDGILRVTPTRPLTESDEDLLQSFAVQAALALERLRYLDEAQRSKVQRETERMRNTLLGAISHDLRTPLAAIQGAASSLLLQDLPAPERQDLLAMIADESERLTQILSNLLDLTRLESETLRIHKEWLSLEEVLASALRRAERRHGGLEIQAHLPEELPLAPLDGALMEQLLSNLLSNALRHAPGSPVELRAWAEPQRLELALSDQGPGIPEAFRNQVFEKFFRLPGATDGGTGLGLAICDAIARAHGGRLWVEAREGGGACFRLSLPLEGEAPAPPPEVEG